MTEETVVASPSPAEGTPGTHAGQYPEQRIAHAIAHELGPGDLAELRRSDPHDPSVPAFWKLLVTHVPAERLPEYGPRREEAEQAWAASMRAMAILDGLHDPNAALGRALALAGFSELRFARLLRAQGDSLFDSVRLAARFLASAQVPADGAAFARLILSDGAPYAEQIRRQLARDYFANLEEG